MKRLLLTTALLFTACSTPPKKSFEFRAVDSHGSEVPCLLVVNGNWTSGEFVQGLKNKMLQFLNEEEPVHVTLQPTRIVEKPHV